MKYEMYDIFVDDIVSMTSEEYIRVLERDLRYVLAELDRYKPLAHGLRQVMWKPAERVEE